MKKSSFPLSNWIVKGLCFVLLLTVGGLGWIIYHATSGSPISFNWNRFNGIALLFACLGLVGSWLVEGLRIQLIARGLGESLSFRRTIGINLATAFTGNITPFNSGGVPTQIYLLSRDGLQPGKASAIVTIRVIMSTLVFSVLVPFLLLFYRSRYAAGIIHQAAGVAIPLATLISLLLIALIFQPKLASGIFSVLFKIVGSLKLFQKLLPKVEKFQAQIEIFHGAMREFRRGICLYLVIICSGLYWLLFFAIAPCLMFALGIDVNRLFWEIIILQFLLIFVVSYLPAPGGSGITELSLYSMLVFIPANLRALFIICWRLLSYYISTVVGGIVLLRFIQRPSHPELGVPN